MRKQLPLIGCGLLCCRAAVPLTGLTCCLQAPGSEMKVKVLQRKLMAALQGRHGDFAVEVQRLLEADMISKLTASSKFRLSSKKVALLS